MGYNLVEKALLQRDWDLYVPVLEDTKIDCIAIKENKIHKIQIKTIQKDGSNKYLPVRKINHNQGEYKIHLYNIDEINFFFGVDLDTENIYVVPIEFSSKFKSSISINTLKPYLNNFDLMEPCNRNITSGEDDIGESLTANTEGTINR